MAIALALLLVAGAVTGGRLLWGGNDDGPVARKTSRPHRVDSRLDWVVPAPKAPLSRADTAAAWFAHGNLIQADKNNVVAYDMDGGGKRWSLPVPGDVCGTSRDFDGDTAVVLYGAAGRLECDQIMAVNLKEGTKRWAHPLPEDGTWDSSSISLSDGVINMASVGAWASYAAQDGHEVHRTNLLAEGCADRGSVIDRTMLTHVECKSTANFLVRVDRASGKERWIWKAPEGTEIKNVISTEPAAVVLALSAREGFGDIVVLNDKGRMGSKISLTAGPYDPDCESVRLNSCRRIVVADGILYIPTKPTSGPGGARRNEIAAFDLRSGKKLWSTDVGGGRVNRPVALHEGRLLVYQDALQDEGGKVASLDLKQGRAEPYMRLPAESADKEHRLAGLGSVYFRDGKLIVTGETTGSGEPYVLAFR
ncbi:PQQ-binding-like beta-propeller repeat protein [Streptomyces sp. NPDC050617]|uniref:outer membrane protein assembly factor BamB family protein n=1 Tax=Streptomyces sp. NPDC050617 TaxID=3154628 RepID=UPI00343F21F2